MINFIESLPWWLHLVMDIVLLTLAFIVIIVTTEESVSQPWSSAIRGATNWFKGISEKWRERNRRSAYWLKMKVEVWRIKLLLRVDFVKKFFRIVSEKVRMKWYWKYHLYRIRLHNLRLDINAGYVVAKTKIKAWILRKARFHARTRLRRMHKKGYMVNPQPQHIHWAIKLAIIAVVVIGGFIGVWTLLTRGLDLISMPSGIGSFFHNHITAIEWIVGLIILFLVIRMLIGRFKNKPAIAASGQVGTTTPQPTTSWQKAKSTFGWAAAAGGVSLAAVLLLPFILCAGAIIIAFAPGIREAFHPSHVSPPSSIPAVEAGYHAPEAIARFSGQASQRFNGPDKDSALAFIATALPGDTLFASIVACESHFTQYDYSQPDSALHNPDSTYVIGIAQINTKAHADEIKQLGYDVGKLHDNLAYGALLYKREGVNPWHTSAWCWRDHYVSRPPHWTFDRTPDQLIAGVRDHAVETVVTDAPSDGTWSEPDSTYGRAFDWAPADKRASYEVLLDGKDTLKVSPGTFDTLKYNPKELRFRSSDSTVRVILFTRKG